MAAGGRTSVLEEEVLYGFAGGGVIPGAKFWMRPTSTSEKGVVPGAGRAIAAISAAYSEGSRRARGRGVPGTKDRVGSEARISPGSVAASSPSECSSSEGTLRGEATSVSTSS